MIVTIGNTLSERTIKRSDEGNTSANESVVVVTGVLLHEVEESLPELLVVNVLLIPSGMLLDGI